MKKRALKTLGLVGAAAVAATAVAATASCGGSSEKQLGLTDGGKVLNIYCWNDEFQGRFRQFYPEYKETDANGVDTLKDGTKVKWTINPNDGNNYQDKLDLALQKQETAADDDKVDIFLYEADYALKYVNSKYTSDVKDIGLTDTDMAQMYQYTKDISTNDKGKLKGVSWQATPGLFAYRRSIAKDVLGTDNPTEVQAKLANWTEFGKVAKQMKDKEYIMLSGFDDAYRAYSNTVTQKLVDSKKNVEIPDVLWDWVDQTKDFTDKGYNDQTSLWSAEWAANQGPGSKVFGFFYSTWGINFTLMGNALEDDTKPAVEGNGIFGDYAVCEGPASYYWGGTWIAGADGSDNKSLIKDIMLKMTCDKAIAKKITEDTQDYTNNKAAMNEIANSDFQSAFLGGQNHIKLFAAAADKIDMSNCTAYDQGINENFQNAMKDYFIGKATKEAALETFKTKISQVYPALKLDKVKVK